MSKHVNGAVTGPLIGGIDSVGEDASVARQRQQYYGVPISYVTEGYYKGLSISNTSIHGNYDDTALNLEYYDYSDAPGAVQEPWASFFYSMTGHRYTNKKGRLMNIPVYTYRVDSRDYPYSVTDSSDNIYGVYATKKYINTSTDSVNIGHYVQDSLFGVPTRNDGSKFEGYIRFREMQVDMFPTVELLTNITTREIYEPGIGYVKNYCDWTNHSFFFKKPLSQMNLIGGVYYDENGIAVGSENGHKQKGYIAIRVTYPEFKVNMVNAFGESVTLFDSYEVLQSEYEYDQTHPHYFDSFFDAKNNNDPQSNNSADCHRPFRSMCLYYFNMDDTNFFEDPFGNAYELAKDGNTSTYATDGLDGFMTSMRLVGADGAYTSGDERYGSFIWRDDSGSLTKYTNDEPSLEYWSDCLKGYSTGELADGGTTDSWDGRRQEIGLMLYSDLSTRAVSLQKYINEVLYWIAYRVYVEWDDTIHKYKLKVKRQFRETDVYSYYTDHLYNGGVISNIAYDNTTSFDDSNWACSLEKTINDITEYSIVTPRMLWGTAWGLWNKDYHGTLKEKNLTSDIWTEGLYSIHWDKFNTAYGPSGAGVVDPTSASIGDYGCPMIMDSSDGDPERFVNPVYGEEDESITYKNIYSFGSGGFVSPTGVCDDANNYYDCTMCPSDNVDTDKGKIYFEFKSMNDLRKYFDDSGIYQAYRMLNKDLSYFRIGSSRIFSRINNVKVAYEHESVQEGTYTAIPQSSGIYSEHGDLLIEYMKYAKGVGTPHSSFESLDASVVGSVDGMKGYRTSAYPYTNIYNVIQRDETHNITVRYRGDLNEHPSYVYGPNYYMGTDERKSVYWSSSYLYSRDRIGSVLMYPYQEDTNLYSGVSIARSMSYVNVDLVKSSFSLVYGDENMRIDDVPNFYTVLDNGPHLISMPVKYEGRSMGGSETQYPVKMYAYAIMQNIDSSSYEKIMNTYTLEGVYKGDYDGSTYRDRSYGPDAIYRPVLGNDHDGYRLIYNPSGTREISFPGLSVQDKDNGDWDTYAFPDVDHNNHVLFLGGKNGYLLSSWKHTGESKSVRVDAAISGSVAKNYCASGFGTSSILNTDKYIIGRIGWNENYSSSVSDGVVCYPGDTKYVYIYIPSNNENKCRYFDIVIKYYFDHADTNTPFVVSDSSAHERDSIYAWRLSDYINGFVQEGEPLINESQYKKTERGIGLNSVYNISEELSAPDSSILNEYGVPIVAGLPESNFRLLFDISKGSLVYPPGTVIDIAGLCDEELNNYGMCIDDKYAVLRVQSKKPVRNNNSAIPLYNDYYAYDKDNATFIDVCGDLRSLRYYTKADSDYVRSSGIIYE